VPLLASKTWYDRGTSKQVIAARELEAKDFERLSVGSVADAIIQVVTAESAAEVSRVSLRFALANLELNQRRARLGSASQVDVLRMEQEVARSRAQVINADEAIRRARENLGLALGTSQPWGVAPDISLNALAEQARNSCTTEDSIDTRLDVRAAEANAAIAQRNVTSIDYTYVPTIDGVSSATYWSDDTRTANGESVTWTIGAVLSWNIYDGGFRYGTRQVNEAQLAIAQEAVTDKSAERVSKSTERCAASGWRKRASKSAPRPQKSHASRPGSRKSRS
jgi:outer membrane protein TolC